MEILAQYPLPTPALLLSISIYFIQSTTHIYTSILMRNLPLCYLVKTILFLSPKRMAWITVRLRNIIIINLPKDLDNKCVHIPTNLINKCQKNIKAIYLTAKYFLAGWEMNFMSIPLFPEWANKMATVNKTEQLFSLHGSVKCSKKWQVLYDWYEIS